MNFETLKEHKVFGIPLLYVIGLAVAVFGVVAWKLKTPTTAADVPADSADTSGPDASADESLFAGLGTSGTVVAAPSTVAQADVPQMTNDQWVKQGVDYLVSSNLATGGVAQAALTAYINGEDLSYDQGVLRDAVIKKYSIPPEPLGVIGKTGSQPAQRQFTEFPGHHTVKGNSDTTASELAQLYYGHSDISAYQEIEAANPTYGHSGVFPVGTSVAIPAFHAPKYISATNTMHTLSQIAAANGLSQAGVQILNPTLSFPVKVGTKVRVQ